MIKQYFIKVLLLLLCLPLCTYAAVPEWEIEPAKSKLTFIATQNGAPIKGSFKHFTGEIYFDPNDLAQSHVKISVNINSIKTPFEDLTQTLGSNDWFHSAKYPNAIFTAKEFKKKSANEYQADGQLTIRNKTSPITITFKGNDFSKPEVHVTGSADLHRSKFGVGQGEWASTNEIKDEVKVTFDLTAKKA